MILFVLILLFLAALAQYFLTKDSLRDVREDYRPETNVAEPGQVFYLRVTLNNTGRRYLPFLRFSVFFPAEIRPQDPSHCTKRLDGQGSTVSYTTWLRPHQQADFRIPLRIDARGRYVFRPLTVSGGDFLGLHEEERKCSRFREVVIAPAELPAPEMEIAMGGVLGENTARRFLYEDPVLTAGFREYTGQEPMRRISWTQSARGRGLMVKNDDYTVEPTVSVILNAESHSLDPADDPEECFSMARTVCRILEERRIPYDLYTNTLTAGGWYNEGFCRIRNGIGSVHYGKVLELLGRATDTVSVPGSVMLLSVAEEKNICGRILITTVSGMPDAQSLKQLRAVSGGTLLILRPSGFSDRRKEAAG